MSKEKGSAERNQISQDEFITIQNRLAEMLS
jgi:hypothetical protein